MPTFNPTEASRASKEAPQYREMAVYCDETGTSGTPFFGFGSLWAPWPRRGDIARLVRDVRTRGFDQELKWSNVGKRNLPMYLEVVREFFERPNMAFHCLLVGRGYLGPLDGRKRRQEVMSKFYLTLLHKKVEVSARGRPDRRFRVRVDRLSSLKTDAEVMGIILDRMTKKLNGTGLIVDVREVDSAKSAAVQICDVLLGAVA